MRRIAVALAALAIVTALAPQASALTFRQREKRWVVHHPRYRGYTGGGKLHLTVPTDATSTRCKTSRIGFIRQYREWFLVSYTAWHLNPHYRWCWRDGKLASASRYIDKGTAGYSGWTWDGWDAQVSSSGTNSAGHEYHYWRDKGSFRVCLAFLLPICIRLTVWASMTVRGDGSWYFQTDQGYTNGRRSP